MPSVQYGIVRLTSNRAVNPYNSRDPIEEYRVPRVCMCVFGRAIRDFFFVSRHRGISERSFFSDSGSMLANIESLDRLVANFAENTAYSGRREFYMIRW